jgi:8-oxo-dGTP pyrophosphatase MutT (NUDIX family)
VDDPTAPAPGPYYAVGALYHPSGRVLLHHRGADAATAPGRWALFGGRSEPEDGGDPVSTWRRELREELGVGLPAERIVPVADYAYLGLRRVVFVAAWPRLTTAFVLGEGQGYAWYGLDEALAHPGVTDQTKADLHRLWRRRGAGAASPPAGPG